MRFFSPDCTSTYRSRGTESNLTSPVAGITRTSIMVSERVDSPSAESGLRSTPRTSTSSGSPEVCSASLAAASLAASFLASCLASFLASRAFLRADWSLVSVVGSRLRDDARSFFVSLAVTRVASAGIVLESPCAIKSSNAAGTKRGDPPVFAVPAEPASSAFKRAAVCVPIPKNRQDRTRTATSRRRRYRARQNRLRFERARLLVFFKAPRHYRSWQANAVNASQQNLPDCKHL